MVFGVVGVLGFAFVCVCLSLFLLFLRMLTRKPGAPCPIGCGCDFSHLEVSRGCLVFRLLFLSEGVSATKSLRLWCLPDRLFHLKKRTERPKRRRGAVRGSFVEHPALHLLNLFL